MSVALSPHAVVTPPSQLLIKMAIAGLLLGAAQHIVLNVIAPRIFGQHMRAPTLILFAALLLGAGGGGVWGAFFAGPVVAVAYAMLEVFYERFSADSPLFQDDDEDDDGASDAPRVNGASAAKPAPPGQWQPSRPTDSAPAIEGPPQRTNALQPPNASDSQPVNHNA